jgi:hypothetical protein
MSDGQRGRHLSRDVTGGRNRHARLDHRAQCPAVDELHRDESAELTFADVVHGDDIRVVQSGGGERLWGEPADQFGVGGVGV